MTTLEVALDIPVSTKQVGVLEKSLGSTIETTGLDRYRVGFLPGTQFLMIADNNCVSRASGVLGICEAYRDAAVDARDSRIDIHKLRDLYQKAWPAGQKDPDADLLAAAKAALQAFAA